MIKSVSLEKTPKIIINPEIHIEKPVIKEGQQAKIDLEMEKACNAIIEEQNKKAAEFIKAAELEKEDILKEAEKQAEFIILEAEKQVETIKTQAYDEGFQQGHDEGVTAGLEDIKQQMQVEIEEAVEKAQRIIKTAEQQTKDNILKAEQQIVEIAVAIAEKVIPQQFNEMPMLVLPLVKSALEKVRDQENLNIRVSPADYELVLLAKYEFQMMIGKENAIVITADKTIENGGCVIETDSGTVDARVSTQMDVLKKAVMDVI